MNNWFLCKVKYRKEDDKGILKNISEAYLVDALSFTEAESRIHEELGSVIRGEFQVTNMSKSRIVDVFEYPDTDNWHKCKVTYVMIDEEAKKEKKVSNLMIVSAANVKEAYERIQESLSSMLVPFQIPEIAETPIVEIFKYKSPDQRVPEGFKPVEKTEEAE
ncbi:DUF4494 family protein [Persicobacter diffluens]|uniref:DUF4494 domain-containing protein n=1 Tax=Persicobacter diffluens TaxID=981 RepID=A0AAN4VXK5_9BACT|nr:hypothetical protein PEDI_16510 [Persicobacter diffluens]